MEALGGLLGLIIVGQLIRLAVMEIGHARRLDATAAITAPDDQENELLTLVHAADWDKFAEADARAWREVDRLPRESASLLATRLSLVRIEYGLVRGRPELVREGLATARANARTLPVEAARRFDLEALALAACATRAGEPDPDALAWGDEALAAAGDDVPWTRTREMLVQAAVQVARARRARGETVAADQAARRALDLCGPRDLRDAYVTASVGALEAAIQHLELGDEASAAIWFDRAELVVAGIGAAACRERRALVLLVRNHRLPGDRLLDAPARRRRNEQALELVSGLGSAGARKLGARACANLGQMDGLDGRHADAAKRFGAALQLLSGLADPESARVRVEVRIACGQARLGAQDPEGVHEFQLALDEAAAAEDPETRSLALGAAFALHPRLAALGLHAGAAEVLDRAAQVAASLTGDTGRLAVAQVSLERARAAQLAGRPLDARAQLRDLLARLEDESWDGVEVMIRLALSSLGHLAFGAGDYPEAVDRFERALLMEWPDVPEHDAERAEMEWHLATAQLQLGRPSEARATWRSAFERGRASGLPGGRYASAQSAFQLAEQSDFTAERKEWFTAAVSLAKLCESPAGDQLARRAAGRLEELAGGA